MFLYQGRVGYLTRKGRGVIELDRLAVAVDSLLSDSLQAYFVYYYFFIYNLSRRNGFGILLLQWQGYILPYASRWLMECSKYGVHTLNLPSAQFCKLAKGTRLILLVRLLTRDVSLYCWLSYWYIGRKRIRARAYCLAFGRCFFGEALYMHHTANEVGFSDFMIVVRVVILRILVQGLFHSIFLGRGRRGVLCCLRFARVRI